jgi:ubiquinone/menaquinone biosynthesis C-methylase UbiE
MAMATANEPELVEDLRAFLAHGLILDPYLAGLMGEHFEGDSRQLLAQEAAQFAVRHWREPLVTRTLGDMPAPTRLGRTAAEEVLLSSAAALAHERKGHIHVTRDLAEEARARMQRFITDRNFGSLVRAYVAVTFAENHGAVRHYGRIREHDFASGLLHRPWVQYPLDDELLTGLLQGTYRLAVEESERWVQHTEEGERQYQRVRRLLEESGYLERRLQLIYLSQFNLLQDWDANVARIIPGAQAERRAFTAFAGLPAGGTVLEVGCGMGSQTFEGGVWQAVGSSGVIVGLDPAPGMLERAQTKIKQYRAKNVRFVVGRAEHMPMFRDGEFDATVGTAFLHFTDVLRALRELRRVTRPGGIIAAAVPCRFPFTADWFQEWFAPIFELAHQHRTTVRQLLPEPGEIPRRFREAGLQDVQVDQRVLPWIAIEPELTVAHLLEGVSFFQAEVELLPWAARQALLEQLKCRGEEICARTSPEERTIQNPMEFVKGTVPPA